MSETKTRRWRAEIVVEFDTEEPHAAYRAQDEATILASRIGGIANRLTEIAAPEATR